VLTPTFPDGSSVLTEFDVEDVLDLRSESPELTFLVPPDPERTLVSKRQYKQIFTSGPEPNGHGFDLIDAAQETASRGAAGYYSFRPPGVDGLRMIALDTIAEGGVILESAEGNLDDPQMRWLERELRQAEAAGELVILFSHHAPASMTADFADEEAPPCEAVDPDDDPPGCDLDPRSSTPIHVGPGACANGAPASVCRDDMISVLRRHPNVIAWMAGHSHVNRVEPFVRPDGGGFWVVRVAAEADWPQQSRLLQLFDNRDGTLSLFGTILDHASPSGAEPTGTPASGLSSLELASIGRTLAYNDRQSGAAACAPTPCGEGAAADRNVELLVNDPRGLRIAVKPRRRKVGVGRQARFTVRVTNDRGVRVPGVRVCVKRKQGLEGDRCRGLGAVPPDGSETEALRLKARRSAAGRTLELGFTATGRGVEPTSATATLKVARRK
jgi:hypothetical protein